MSDWRIRFARWFAGDYEPPSPAQSELNDLREQVAQLTEKLAWSEQKLRERSELLYDLQKQYSAEHFELSVSSRELKTERLRNAGAFAGRDVVVSRAQDLQHRIGQLKECLRKYEAVDDLFFDDGPILIESADGIPVQHPDAERLN